MSFQAKSEVGEICIYHHELDRIPELRKGFPTEKNEDSNKGDFLNTVWWNVSTFERAEWLSESVLSKRPAHDNTKSFISNRSLQRTRETNGFQQSRAGRVHWYGFRFHFIPSRNFKKLPLPEYWYSIKEYPQLPWEAKKVLLCFPTTYLSKARFSSYTSIKAYQNRLGTEVGVRIQLSDNMKPDTKEIYENTKPDHSSHCISKI